MSLIMNFSVRFLILLYIFYIQSTNSIAYDEYGIADDSSRRQILRETRDIPEQDLFVETFEDVRIQTLRDNAREEVIRFSINADDPSGTAGSERAYSHDEKHHNSKDSVLRTSWSDRKHIVSRPKERNSDVNANTVKDQKDPMVSYFTRTRRVSENWLMNITCDVCEVVMLRLQSMIKNRTADEEIVKEITRLCIFFKIEDARVCDLVVRQFQDEGLYIATNLVLSPKEVCGMLIGDGCAIPYFPGQLWNVTLPDTRKPAPKPPTPPKPGSPTVRVLHLTDIHIDLLYKPGANIDCGEPLCCRSNDYLTTPSPQYGLPTSTAGKYGEYKYCDLSLTLANDLFSHLRSIKDQFDYIMFSGDIPAHDVWNQSKSDQVEHVLTLDKLFSQYLPDKPVYSCVGNHEASPINSFPPPDIPKHTMDWLYSSLAVVWGKWLPQSALPTIMRCGSYSISPYPGFRIISVNNNYCNNGNGWLLLNSTDPCNVLAWLIQELQGAEDRGEKVHILTHIPPGSPNCLKVWSKNYYTIINRYENTVVNQFYGHNHKDWFEMFYDEETLRRPVGFGFVSPSVTTYSFNNPIYRIYTVDGNYTGSSWAVLDYNNYYLNLTEANLEDTSTWKHEYSPKTAFNMKSVYAADWEDLIQRMEKDDDLFQLFYKYYRNLYPTEPCHGDCKTSLLCQLMEGRSYDPDLCTTHWTAQG